MNKTYALIWNQSQGCWSAVGETARRRGKSAGGKRLAAAAISLLGFAALPAFALPTGEAVTHGKADILRDADGKSMSVNQHSDKLVTNWQHFSVAGGERVSFRQPGSQSIALNRVIGNNGSQIHGSIDANGKVFLVNPNGVLFGAGAQINVGGLVASTQALSDADFVAGNYRFAGNSAASIVNDGTIAAADGGSVALLGARVSNNGVIQAKMGRVALGAGNAFKVNFDGSDLLSLQVEGGAVDAQASNGGLLKADGGEVLMTARAAGNLLDAVVNNAGTIEAKGLSGRGGKITLDGGAVNVAGTLDAAGDAIGTVLTRGERVDVAASTRVDTRGASGHAGAWTIAAKNAGVFEQTAESATNSANGDRSIGASTLARNLDTTNIQLTNTAGDLTVGGDVAWASDNALTLSSTTGRVDLQRTLVANGTHARLVVNAADQIRVNDAVKLTGRHAHLELNAKNGRAFAAGKAAVTLSGSNASFRANGEDYNVLHTVADLRNVDANLNGRYVLGNAIDGANANFRSIGGDNTFSGVFDGLGNTIGRLSVTNTAPNIGLFARNSGEIANLTLDSLVVDGTAASRSAFIGGLVGDNLRGRIFNVNAKNMSVSHHGRNVGQMGGLVGRNLGTIEHARFTGRVTGSAMAIIVGGLAGTNSGTIADSEAAADVVLSGVGSTISRELQSVGGLVGTNAGHIVLASSSGRVAGRDNTNTGGLVGINSGTIRDASTTATVSATKGGYVGGFAGRNRDGGTISDASATGPVTATGAIATGGFVGENARGMLDAVSSAGDVTDLASNNVGGLAGANGGTIRNARATATVTAGRNSHVGGLVGTNDGTVRSARADGTVGALDGSDVGGLVGLNTGVVDTAEAAVDVKAGNDSRAGGLIGTNRGGNAIVRHASASGNAAADNSNVGGLVGLNDDGATIENASSSGTISGDRSNLGGLVGENAGTIRESKSSSRLDLATPTYGPWFWGSFVGLNTNTGNINAMSVTGQPQDHAMVGLSYGMIDGERVYGPAGR
ncbi:GLUG motif-containing protein [Burkholderia sp. SR8]|uniref:two-partner secretion domain-containing protein n=1 Tax=Burkholderia sp. SR8 TaxID=3062277 RepID=UPI00406450EE